MLISKVVRPPFHQLWHSLEGQHPLQAVGLVVAAGIAGAVMWRVKRTPGPTPEEMERRRRERISAIGRITDGVILDTRTLSNEESSEPTPEVLIYSYRLAGVTYECAQDVSGFPEKVTDCRLDQPVQVRYDPRNPGNSLIVSESWTGVWRPGQRRQ
jgi:hypothetical protein